MNKLILVGAVLLSLVFSGCENTAGESKKTSSQTSDQITKETESTATKDTKHTSNSEKEPVKTPETQKAGEKITGVWMAKGQQDGVRSTWYFNDGSLMVNYKYPFSYDIAKNKDPHGYTVVTIKNSEGKQHALLLEKKSNHIEGITVEGKAYQNYLANHTVPNGQIIEFSLQKNAWGSMDEAINFYEKTYKNASNKISKDIIWDNYRRDLWTLVKEDTAGNTITLHWTNIGGAGGSYDQFVKNADTTELTFFDGNAGYPDHPTIRYTIRNSDNKVIKTEKLWGK